MSDIYDWETNLQRVEHRIKEGISYRWNSDEAAATGTAIQFLVYCEIRANISEREQARGLMQGIIARALSWKKLRPNLYAAWRVKERMGINDD